MSTLVPTDLARAVSSRGVVALAAVGSLSLALTGCTSRASPFGDLDDASVTILKLQGQEVAPTPTMPGAGGIGGFPLPFPVPPELQQGLGALGQGLGGIIPPGLLPPGLIPAPGGTPMPPAAAPRFNGFVILAQQPLMDEDMKDEILDLFGDEDSFNANRGQCFYPGLGIVFQDPSMAPVELMVSFSCNQAMGNGFRWPHEQNGLTPESSNSLRLIHERLFGPVPPTGA